MVKTYSFRRLQLCAEREVALRRRVYEKQGMTAQRQEELDMMVAIAGHLKEQAERELRDAENPFKTG